MCLRYDEKVDTPFLHEAQMANVLRHKNMLSIYGVVTGSSYSPNFALVSLTTKSFYLWSLTCRNLAEQHCLKAGKSFLLGLERKKNAKLLNKLFTSLARSMLLLWRANFHSIVEYGKKMCPFDNAKILHLVHCASLQ